MESTLVLHRFMVNLHAPDEEIKISVQAVALETLI